MKKLTLLIVALILCALASWAQLPAPSFTIWPESSGNFTIYYSTYGAPTGNVVWVNWGDGIVKGFERNNNGSNPNKGFSGNVTKGTPIKIYSNYLDAIEIHTRAAAIKCESNNPQLQYIYYLNDNLNSQALEALYFSLIDRNHKTAWGELHLSQTTTVADAGNNILQSNAFAALDKKWQVCSMKDYKGNKYWKLDENACKENLKPAIRFITLGSYNISDLQLGIKPMPGLPFDVPTAFIRIEDGTSNHKSVSVSNHLTNSDFESNATKLSVNTRIFVDIYGAFVSHVKLNTHKISGVVFSGPYNLRYLNLNNCSNNDMLFNLFKQLLLEDLYLTNNSSLKEVDVASAPGLKKLHVSGCVNLTTLNFDSKNLEELYFSECPKLLSPSFLTGVIENAAKLKTIHAENLWWSYLKMNELYGLLRNHPSSFGAKIYVDNVLSTLKPNDWARSDFSIATNKGWKVYQRWDEDNIPLSISQIEADKLIKIYPNPASDLVNITIGENLNAESLQVVDFTGKTIFNSPLVPNNSEYQINVSDYAKGIYLIRVGNFTRKLIVK